MKTLVTYFSQSGNTENVAKTIYAVAAEAGDADLKRIDEFDPAETAEYDFIFVGSPIQKQVLPDVTIAFVAKLHPRQGTRFAGFITHSAPAYPPQALEEMTRPFTDTCRKKGMVNTGVFDCQGYLADVMHKSVQEMRKLDDTAWAERVAQMKGHPNEEDLAGAVKFTKSTLGL